jgi:hypothetical protein
MLLASYWLRNCEANHRPWKKLQALNELPSRIINVSDPDRPFLEDGHGRHKRYIALSYKWGDVKKFQTTTANLDSHKHVLPLQKLPWTFRDAMDVTRNLGFQWLWIDALCIVQDCDEERKLTLSKMESIFQRATLTLFAECGTDVKAGLSSLRDPRAVRPCQLTVRTTLDG